MRACLLAVAVLSGCLFGESDRPPAAIVVITAPEDGVVITDHEPVVLTVEVANASVTKLELVVDGAILPGVTVSPLPAGAACAPCTFQLTWDAVQADEGPNVATVLVYGDSPSDPVGYADLALAFDDTPEITAAIPAANEDLTGVGMLDVTLGVKDRGATTVTLAIDGTLVGTEQRPSCKTGCSLRWPWDTRALPAGMHDLTFTVSDSKGHVVEQTHTVKLDDVITITAMQVTGMTDESGTLEIEVYVFDNVTNKLLGCVGSAGGLGPVDASDVRYNLNATLIDLAGDTLGSLALAPNAVRFEVWEDDDTPVCPTALNPSGNDLVGVSPARTAAQWKATTMSTFGNVTELRAVFERPLQR